MARKTTKGPGKSGNGKGTALASGGSGASGNVPAEAPAQKKKRTGVFQFIQEVRNETSKVTWPSGKETMITTVMVFIMVILAMIYLGLVDWGIQFVIGQLLSLGGGGA